MDGSSEQYTDPEGCRSAPHSGRPARSHRRNCRPKTANPAQRVRSDRKPQLHGANALALKHRALATEGGPGRKRNQFTVSVKVVLSFVLAESLPVPATVKVYVPGLVALLVVVPLPPPPQADRPAVATRSTTRPNSDRQLRRRPGMPRKTSIARVAPPAAPSHPRPLPPGNG